MLWPRIAAENHGLLSSIPYPGFRAETSYPRPVNEPGYSSNVGHPLTGGQTTIPYMGFITVVHFSHFDASLGSIR
jgi:hypothetical protein